VLYCAAETGVDCLHLTTLHRADLTAHNGFPNQAAEANMFYKRVFLILLVCGLSACSTNPRRQDVGTVSGAVVGGVVGAVVTGGSTWGTVAGAAAGSLVGTKVGKEMERR
jgi:osmotically inducible lipoprotein OsmB